MFSSVTPFQAPSASSQASTTSPEETERALKESEMRQAAQDFEASFIAQMLTFSGLGEALTAGGGEEVSAFTSFYIYNNKDLYKFSIHTADKIFVFNVVSKKVLMS